MRLMPDHSEWYEKAYHEILERGDLNAFTDPNSIWHWMHVHCMKPLDGFLRTIPSSTFLTLGDGYCAREGSYISKFGHDVTASDRELCLINVAMEYGLISHQAPLDMNNLCGCEPDSYDLAFVKESLHHSPTPYVALAEMMRVARKGVILIEPTGEHRAERVRNDFEAEGNYLFTFRSDELMHIGLAYGYKFFAYYYTMIFYGHHNVDNIVAGRITEEKERLLAIESKFPPDTKPLLAFMFFNDRETFDCLPAGINKMEF